MDALTSKAAAVLGKDEFGAFMAFAARTAEHESADRRRIVRGYEVSCNIDSLLLALSRVLKSPRRQLQLMPLLRGVVQPTHLAAFDEERVLWSVTGEPRVSSIFAAPTPPAAATGLVIVALKHADKRQPCFTLAPRRDGSFEVAHVAADSSATRVGLAIGDVVLAIGTARLQHKSPPVVDALLRAQRKLRLIVRPLMPESRLVRAAQFNVKISAAVPGHAACLPEPRPAARAPMPQCRSTESSTDEYTVTMVAGPGPLGLSVQGGDAAQRHLSVHALAPGSHAARCGLVVGSSITRIGQHNTAGMGHTRAAECIRSLIQTTGCLQLTCTPPMAPTTSHLPASHHASATATKRTASSDTLTAVQPTHIKPAQGSTSNTTTTTSTTNNTSTQRAGTVCAAVTPRKLKRLAPKATLRLPTSPTQRPSPKHPRAADVFAHVERKASSKAAGTAQDAETEFGFNNSFVSAPGACAAPATPVKPTDPTCATPAPLLPEWSPVVHGSPAVACPVTPAPPPPPMPVTSAFAPPCMPPPPSELVPRRTSVLVGGLCVIGWK